MTSRASAIAAHVAVVVVDWNGAADTRACLRSLLASRYEALSVVVVDNGSRRPLRDELSDVDDPRVAFLRNDENLGFAGGNNVGIDHALAHGADLVFLLNNDTTIAPDAIGLMVGTLGDHPEYGAVGALTFYHDEPDRVAFAGGRWDERALEMVSITDRPAGDGAFETEHVSGCALMVRAGVVREVGALDERFFLLWEETDWCHRIRAAGHKLAMSPAAHVWHKVSRSFEGGVGAPHYRYFYLRNKLLYLRRSCPLSVRVRHWLGTVLPLLWALVCGALSRKRADESARRHMRAERAAIWHYLIGRFGPGPAWLFCK